MADSDAGAPTGTVSGNTAAAQGAADNRVADDGAAPGQRLARGVCRAFARHGWTALTEFTLKDGRRADVIALDGRGTVAIVEVKSSRADFRADGKWQDYLAFCDRFYFAVPPAFPRALLPEGCGVLVADAYGAEVLTPAPEQRLHASRRRAVTLRFAQAAGQRLLRAQDPQALIGDG
jgi:hypothetical protein